MLLVAGIGASETRSAASVCLRATPLAFGCEPQLEFDLEAAVVPRKLPRHEKAPVALQFRGRIHNSDGSHPSALRETVIDFDEDLTIDTTGLPTCKRTLLRVRNTKAARNVCRDSIVGKGSAHLAIVSVPERESVALTLFNGGVNEGRRTLYVHAFISEPMPSAIVTTISIRKIKKGGLHTVSKVPVIAGGGGSLLDFDFTIERLFTSNGTKKSYLVATCLDGDLEIRVQKAVFRNEAQTPGVASMTALKGGIVVPCSPSGR